MKRTHLLDSSAVLAVLFRETGSDVVLQHIDDCDIHAINLAEVVTKLAVTGIPRDEIQNIISKLELPVIERFESEQALHCGMLAPICLQHGLSLGDRVCLTAASCLDRTVITADRKWSEVPHLGIRIVQIRP